jgi:hypothetical protein
MAEEISKLRYVRQMDVIYFKVEGMAVEINTRSKKLLSVLPNGGTRDQHLVQRHQRSVTAKLYW